MVLQSLQYQPVRWWGKNCLPITHDVILVPFLQSICNLRGHRTAVLMQIVELLAVDYNRISIVT